MDIMTSVLRIHTIRIHIYKPPERRRPGSTQYISHQITLSHIPTQQPSQPRILNQHDGISHDVQNLRRRLRAPLAHALHKTGELEQHPPRRVVVARDRVAVEGHGAAVLDEGDCGLGLGCAVGRGRVVGVVIVAVARVLGQEAHVADLRPVDGVGELEAGRVTATAMVGRWVV